MRKNKGQELLATNVTGEQYILHPDGDDPEIRAYNQGGFDFTSVNLLIVIAWVKKNRPELLGGKLAKLCAVVRAAEAFVNAEDQDRIGEFDAMSAALVALDEDPK